MKTLTIKSIRKIYTGILFLTPFIVFLTLSLGRIFNVANAFPQTTIITANKIIDQSNLRDLFSKLCWVAYSPTSFDPTQNRFPLEESVRQDLQILRNAGFDGLVTYGSNLRKPDKHNELINTPKIAEEVGFKAMIVGVWDPNSKDELQAAIESHLNPIVVGYSVGNEGLNVRYGLKTLSIAIEWLRQKTGKPVTTTEEPQDYLDKNSPLWSLGDWIFPNIHAYFANRYEPEEAVKWTLNMFNKFYSMTDKPLIFKEVGLPSSDGISELTESDQSKFYELLKKTNVNYVVFEAFDQNWKSLKNSQSGRDPEPHWGIFTSDRKPKKVIKGVCSR